MRNHPRILVQTTIPTADDDWSIARFSLLVDLLRSETDPDGGPAYEVVARDRDPLGKPDSVLSTLDESGFDALWLFAVDAGNGLVDADCEAISRFRRKGRGLMVTRDHMDLGSSLCSLAGVGKAHHFHTRNLDPDVRRRVIDDPYSTHILWPNFHSGRNGDFQKIETIGPIHPVLEDRESPLGAIRLLPSHPHEGAVSAPSDEPARVIAVGRSKISGAPFNLVVAFEASEGGGRAIAQSTFHHFADYNWDPAYGCPSFVDEPAGTGMASEPGALKDVHRYVLNVARWLVEDSRPAAER
jgi:hypothetical protein